MRNLKSTDLFAALRVVKEVGVKEEMRKFAELFQSGKVTAKTQNEVGIELLIGILSNCGTENAEKAFFSFLAGPTEIPESDLRNMDLEEFADTIKSLVESIDLEHWKAFFTQLARLIPKQK